MTLRLVSTNDTPSNPETDQLVRWILTMWATKRMDTETIARFAKIPEATVYNALAAYREQKRKQGGNQ
jgi:hypothetical protein